MSDGAHALDGGAARLDPRRARIRLRVLRKVELLEGWAAADGCCAPAKPRATRAAFRRWADAGLGLEAWSDSHLDADDGPFADLMLRRRAALDAIRTARKAHGSAGAKVAADDPATWAAARALLDATNRPGRPPAIPGRR